MIKFYFYVSCVVFHVSFGHYTHQWAVHVLGGKEVADKLAQDHGFRNLGEIFPDYYHFEHPRMVKRSLSPDLEKKTSLSVDTRVLWAQQQVAKRRIKRDYKLQDSDPRWPNMWYLNRGNGLDMNVIPAWLDGITGKGAVVTILDDGLEKDHPDLSQNYDPMASYDVNDQDSDPSPRYDMIDSNRHGTRCAGEVAAVSNNSICALGVAHGAQVGGVRMLDGDVTDAVEARSLSYNPQHIDIYSASWGPDDDGKTVDGPGEFATRAFIEGVTKGRNGKGSIFVWASGNGGKDHDNCNCDGYTNSIYTLSISSATEQGHVPWYSEACSSTLASTYSSGAVEERQVVTTDLHHSCTSSHTGTSASAPLAAGICALALEANPNLTWRDMQHIVVRTARPQNLITNDWKINGVGRNVSHSFGYGLMDAYAMVQLAKRWVTVPEQHNCEIPAPHAQKIIPAKGGVRLQLEVKKCDGVKLLEHVQAKLTISSQRRGDLKIQLTSPMGTRVMLLAHRANDMSKAGFNHWPFMSVHSWGESPFGIWQLEIRNDDRLLGRAVLQNWSLVLYGTKEFVSISEQPNYNKNFRVRPNLKKKTSKKQKKIKIASTNVKLPKTTNKTKNRNNNSSINSRFFPAKITPVLTKNRKLFTTPAATPTISHLFYNTNKINESLMNINIKPYWKFVKNISLTYPVMIPVSRGTISRESFKKTQKPKEKSRDLNSNHSSKTLKNKVIESTATAEILTTIKGKTNDAEIRAWDMILYGTATAPAIDNKKSSISETFEHNSIDEFRGGIEMRRNTTEIEHGVSMESSSDCIKSNGRFCLECSLEYVLHKGKCLERCPDQFYSSELEISNGADINHEKVSERGRVCLPCHYTCKMCVGSNDYQCVQCFPDATLVNISNWESYCYSSRIIGNITAQKWYIRVYVLLWIILSGLLIVIIYFIIPKRNGERVDFDVIKNIRGMEKNVKSAVYSDSDGE